MYAARPWSVGSARDDPLQIHCDPPRFEPSGAEALRLSGHSRLSCSLIADPALRWTPEPRLSGGSLSCCSWDNLPPDGHVHLSGGSQIGADQIQVIHADIAVILLGLQKIEQR